MLPLEISEYGSFIHAFQAMGEIIYEENSELDAEEALPLIEESIEEYIYDDPVDEENYSLDPFPVEEENKNLILELLKPIESDIRALLETYDQEIDEIHFKTPDDIYEALVSYIAYGYQQEKENDEYWSETVGNYDDYYKAAEAFYMLVEEIDNVIPEDEEE